MSATLFSAEGRPTILMDERLVDDAIGFGATRIQADRDAIDATVRFATQGSTVSAQTGRELGGVLIWNMANMSELTRERLVHIPESGSLEEAKDGERLKLSATGKMADEANVTLLDIHSRRPIERKLTRGLYDSANRLTTDNNTHICSKNDKWFGGAIGFGLTLANEVTAPITGTPTIGEWMGVPYVGGAVTGLVAGRLLLAPAISMLRRTNDLRIMRDKSITPIRIS